MKKSKKEIDETIQRLESLSKEEKEEFALGLVGAVSYPKIHFQHPNGNIASSNGVTEFTCIHLDLKGRPIRLCTPFKFKSEYLFKAYKKWGTIAIRNSAGKYLSYQNQWLKTWKVPKPTWVDKIGEKENFQLRRISVCIHLDGATDELVPLVALKTATGNDKYYLDIGLNDDDSSFAFTKAKNNTDKISWSLDPFNLRMVMPPMVDYSSIVFRHMDGEYLTEDCKAEKMISPPSYSIALLDKTGEGAIIQNVENILSYLHSEGPKTVVITTTSDNVRYLTCSDDGKISFTRSQNPKVEHEFELGMEKKGYRMTYSLKSKKTGDFLNITAKNIAKRGRRLCLSHDQGSTVWSLTHSMGKEYRTQYAKITI